MARYYSYVLLCWVEECKTGECAMAEFEIIDGADHFYSGRMEILERVVSDYLKRR